MSRNWRHKNLAKIIAVVGPTASGKTSLAIKLAQQFSGEIVSADSRQIYRGMDVGTAKPRLINQSRTKTSNFREYSRAKLEIDSRIPHHLIDIKNPDEEYTAADYKRDALRAIRGILRHGRVPVIAGGTGLYVKAVVENLRMPKVKADPKLRRRLEKEMTGSARAVYGRNNMGSSQDHGSCDDQKISGLNRLVKKLLESDPEAARIVDLKNPRRVVRALEVAIQTGKPFTTQRKKGERMFDVLQIGIKIPPEKLRGRINRRVDEMIKAGVVEEIRGLLKKYGPTPALLNTIGYREIVKHFSRVIPNTTRNPGVAIENKGSFSGAQDGAERQIAVPRPEGIATHNDEELALPRQIIDEIARVTRAYARRQTTWFRKDKNIHWIRTTESTLRLAEKFLSGG